MQNLFNFAAFAGAAAAGYAGLKHNGGRPKCYMRSTPMRPGEKQRFELVVENMGGGLLDVKDVHILDHGIHQVNMAHVFEDSPRESLPLTTRHPLGNGETMVLYTADRNTDSFDDIQAAVSYRTLPCAPDVWPFVQTAKWRLD